MNDINYILQKIQHKDKFKSTTTLKFKKDIVDILMCGFDGDILEIGTNMGNTTIVLAWVGKMLNKKVYSFENNLNHIKIANERCKFFNVDCNIVQKDVYNEKWNVDNIGCVFIDCVHTEKCFMQDIENSIKITSSVNNPILLIHDYGLQLSNGESISNVINGNQEKYKIIRYLGEENNWNPVGTGIICGWEGVQIKII